MSCTVKGSVSRAALPSVSVSPQLQAQQRQGNGAMSDSEEEVEYEVEEVALCPEITLLVTTVAYMPITKLLSNQGKGVEISGQKVWCGSLGAVEYLLGNRGFVQGRVVVEVGAGTGVLGMACKRLGAQRAILTDNDDVSLKHMAEDALRNGFSVEDVRVSKLDWFGSGAEECISAEERGMGLRVVAGDVLYKNCLLEPFMKTVLGLLAAEGGSEMLLCHVPRAGVTHELVAQAGAAAGLSVTELPAESWRKGAVLQCPSEDAQSAKLYRIIKC